MLAIFEYFDQFFPPKLNKGCFKDENSIVDVLKLILFYRIIFGYNNMMIMQVQSSWKQR